MSTFRVEPAQLDGAASTLAAVPAGLGGLSVSAPDPAMYGDLVGSAAAHAEPANTESTTTLLQALTTLGQSLSERCEASARGYRDTEHQVVDLVRAQVSGALEAGTAVVGRGVSV
ncbi:hypothetical protein [Auraticoccus monumenti]|uniref:Excreted virulence factor EspC, type VII ESX diderm n=1 Tax=Auraticoccus monumenti TaxID=675864 RepID=A0A1G6VQV1_9ACTN|nr:hypothetical protein [Auraticoccus monumenti]SDD55911.1 hypothetical protein SAMN04489747_1230 [Auraticoccus monumenti]